jgi:hypothetical protein
MRIPRSRPPRNNAPAGFLWSRFSQRRVNPVRNPHVLRFWGVPLSGLALRPPLRQAHSFLLKSTCGIEFECTAILSDRAHDVLGSRGLAELTRGTNVTVNSVLPGPTRSEGIVDFLKSLASDPEAPAAQMEAEFFAKGRPLGKTGTASGHRRQATPVQLVGSCGSPARPDSKSKNRVDPAQQMNHAERGFRGRRIIAPVRADAHPLTE